MKSILRSCGIDRKPLGVQGSLHTLERYAEEQELKFYLNVD